MTLDEIRAIGKVADGEFENIVLLKYQEQIENFLSSSEFGSWANKPYVPLLNPNTFDYENTEPLEAWVLNMPLPKYYDFVAFGSHNVGFHGAITAFLGLCDAHSVVALRKFVFGDDDNENEDNNSSLKQYLSTYIALVAMEQTKQMGYVKHCYLLLTNLKLDLDTQKFYSLIDARKALHVVRDPIEALRGLVTTQNSVDKLTLENKDSISFGLFFFHNPHLILKNYHTHYRGAIINEKEEKRENLPTLDSIEAWLKDYAQSFHDGILFNLLSGSLQDICLKETKDFFPDKVMDTLNEMGQKFGFEVPKDDEWLFKVSGRGLKNLLPLTIYVNDKFELYNTNKNKFLPTKEDAENSMKLLLVSALDSINKIYPERDITEFFELEDPLFRVFTTANDDKEKLLSNKSLLNKTQFYIKELVKAVLEHIDDVNATRKQITEKDVLEYFKTHKEQRELMKTIMAQHLMILKQIAPNIINSWKYYNEFETLCKELDGE